MVLSRKITKLKRFNIKILIVHELVYLKKNTLYLFYCYVLKEK